MARETDHFLIAEAANLCGLTTAMVDYLCREGVLTPTFPGYRGRGRPRRYSFGDVVMLRALARMLEAGVSVLRLKKALQEIRSRHREISPTALPAPYLVTDGYGVYLRQKRGLLKLDGRGQMSFAFVLELDDLRADVLRAAEVLRPAAVG